jgi:transposase
MSREDAARQYSVSAAWVYGLHKQQRDTRSLAPKNYRCGQRQNLAPYEHAVRPLVTEHPDATLEVLSAKLPGDVPVTVPTLSNFLKHRKIP